MGTDSRSAVSRLHEIYRRLRTAREGRLPAFALAKREAKRVREIYRASRRYSQARDDVASGFQVSRPRQMIDAARFSFSENIDLGSYYKFSYFLSDNWKRRAEYIHHQEIVLLLENLNAAISSRDSEDLADKRRFAVRIEKANLPGIPTAGSFEHGITLLEPSEDVLGKGDLFSKPVDRWCGEGAFRWTARADGYAGPDGAHKTLPQLAEALRLASKDGSSIILQRCITNHPALLPISGRGLSTCRIVTIKYPGASPQPALAAYRMPHGALIADNFAAGGLAAPVDLASGTLGVARQKSRPFVPIKVHPDSGHPIEGSTVPFWRAALDLAVNAHREFQEMPSVGWDVAITESGPVLVEGNAVWCVDLAQITHQRPISDTAVADCLLAHFAVANIPALARR